MESNLVHPSLEALSIEAFLPLWNAALSHRKLIGLDWGTKRIGVAVSDRTGLIASPLQTVLCKQNKPLPPVHARKRLARPQQAPKRKSEEQLLEETLDELLPLIEAEMPLAVGLGVPLNMDGSAGFQSQRVFLFAQRLRERLNNLGAGFSAEQCPLILYDERWSSRAVERLMIEDDRTRAQRQKVVDASAAAYVLQGVLDRLNQGIQRSPERPPF